MKKLVILFIAIAGFAVNSQAQVSATATASAFIVAPITIVNAGNMNFGNVAVGASAGTVILTPGGVRSATLGVTLPTVVPGTITAAHFTVGGTASYTYAITLPVGATTVTEGGGATMTVDTWTSFPTPSGVIGGAGSQTLDVGATLHVGANQPTGLYVSGTPFTVTVNYN